MFFRKRKKKFTQINTFQDSSSGWDSGPVRPQKRYNKDELFQITFDMMKKGSVNPRGGKQVRQFGVMVGTDLKLVTSGDLVDRETYEALLAVDAIEAPNQQMSIPGIVGEQSVPPPKPIVAEAMQHVNPVHNEVVGMASVRPMRRRTDEQQEPSERTPAQGAANALRQVPKAPQAAETVAPPVRRIVPSQASVPDLPSEEVLEKMDVSLPPAPMPKDSAPAVQVKAVLKEDALPPAELPSGVDMEADAFDLPPEDLPDGIDLEEDGVLDAPVAEQPEALEAKAEAPQEVAGHVQTELAEMLGENVTAPNNAKGKRGKPNKRGKKGRR